MKAMEQMVVSSLFFVTLRIHIGESSFQQQ
jgi:hypothetical protein